MGMHRVRAEAHSHHAASAIWTIARDFAAPWHPWVTKMWVEPAQNGQLVRALRVDGDSTVYRERQTWFSDSLREYGYSHLSGIEGVQDYNGKLQVLTDGTGARVVMEATLTAQEPRASDIAKGTQAVFDAGVAALAALKAPGQASPPVVSNAGVLDELRITSDPAIALTCAGQSCDTACLFLHGIGGGRSNWDQQLRAAAPHMRAAAMDLRGYGDSTLGPNQTTVEDHSNDILRAAQALGSKRLVLCGLSFGAWIATSFAMRHPERLAGLILSGGCTGMSEATEETRNGFRESREGPLDAGLTPADFADGVIQIIAAPDSSAEVREALHRSMAAIPVATYRDALRCFTTPPEKFDFSRLTMPVLMMTGAHDRLAPPAEIESVARRIHAAQALPDVRFERLDGAGHVCNLDRPDLYNAAMTEFLRRVAQ